MRFEWWFVAGPDVSPLTLFIRKYLGIYADPVMTDVMAISFLAGVLVCFIVFAVIRLKS